MPRSSLSTNWTNNVLWYSGISSIACAESSCRYWPQLSSINLQSFLEGPTRCTTLAQYLKEPSNLWVTSSYASRRSSQRCKTTRSPMWSSNSFSCRRSTWLAQRHSTRFSRIRVIAPTKTGFRSNQRSPNCNHGSLPNPVFLPFQRRGKAFFLANQNSIYFFGGGMRKLVYLLIYLY